MKRRIAIHLAYFLALGLLFGGAAALAGSVSGLNSFTAGTTARAGEMNANFSKIQTAVNDNYARITANTSNIAANAAAISAINVAAPFAWGQSDVDPSASSWNVSQPVEINRLDIDVPANGILVISGSVYIESGAAAGQTYVLTPYVDAHGVPDQTPPGTPNAFAASFQAGSGGTAGQFTLSYTVTVPVLAGLRTVVQNAGPTMGPVNFSFNKNYLTVVFYPSTHGTFVEGPADGDF